MLFSQILLALSASIALAIPVEQSGEAISEQIQVAREDASAEVQDRAAGKNLIAGVTLASPTTDKAPAAVKAAVPALGSVHVVGTEPIPPLDALTIGWVTPGSKAFSDISVWHHNVHRANHSAPWVSWNTTLYNWAQAKANTCKFNEDGLPGWGSVGMNIAGGTYGIPKVRPNPSSMISGLWYNSELNNFPGYGQANPNYSNFQKWGHFTQVVWPGSKQIGCGLQDCGTSWFGVCLYSPPGNWEGEFNIIGKPKGYPTIYPNGQIHM